MNKIEEEVEDPRMAMSPEEDKESKKQENEALEDEYEREWHEWLDGLIARRRKTIMNIKGGE